MHTLTEWITYEDVWVVIVDLAVRTHLKIRHHILISSGFPEIAHSFSGQAASEQRLYLDYHAQFVAVLQS
jgi:hypothetical protein